MNETTSTTHPVGQHLHVGAGASNQPEQGAKYRQGASPHLHLTKSSFRLDAGAARCVDALIGCQHQCLLLNLAAMRLGRQAPFRDIGLPASGRSRRHLDTCWRRSHRTAWRRQTLSNHSGRDI